MKNMDTNSNTKLPLPMGLKQDENLSRVDKFVGWKMYELMMESPTMRSKGILMASYKKIATVSKKQQDAVKTSISNLKRQGYFDVIKGGNINGKKEVNRYIFNMDKWGIEGKFEDNTTQAEDILESYESFSKYTIEVFSQLDSDDEKNFIKCYYNWAKPFTTQVQQTAACKLMFTAMSKFRAAEKNSFAGDIASIMQETKNRLHDVAQTIWMNPAVEDYIDQMYLGLMELTKGIDYPQEETEITPTILTPANTIKDEELTPESALKLYEDATAGIIASSASQNTKNEHLNQLGRHLVTLNNEKWHDPDFDETIWRLCARAWMKILTPLGIVNTSTNQTPTTNVDEKLFRKIVEEEGGEVVHD